MIMNQQFSEEQIKKFFDMPEVIAVIKGEEVKEELKTEVKDIVELPSKAEIIPTPKKEYKKRGRKRISESKKRKHIALYMRPDDIELIYGAYGDSRAIVAELVTMARAKLKTIKA